MNVKILGSGCSKCTSLEEHVKQALKELGKEAQIEKVTDIVEISKYNVMTTPALVIDEKVVSSGKVSTVEEVKGFLG